MKPSHLLYLIGNYYSLYTENGLDKNIYQVTDVGYTASGLVIQIHAKDVLTENSVIFNGEMFYNYIYNERTYEETKSFIEYFKKYERLKA